MFHYETDVFELSVFKLQSYQIGALDSRKTDVLATICARAVSFSCPSCPGTCKKKCAARLRAAATVSPAAVGIAEPGYIGLKDLAFSRDLYTCRRRPVPPCDAVACSSRSGEAGHGAGKYLE